MIIIWSRIFGRKPPARYTASSLRASRPWRTWSLTYTGMRTSFRTVRTTWRKIPRSTWEYIRRIVTLTSPAANHSLILYIRCFILAVIDYEISHDHIQIPTCGVCTGHTEFLTRCSHTDNTCTVAENLTTTRGYSRM
ncbi:hypothetical protein LCGC14_2187160 [marine sediment metagenome]|uniref:Uncharacterized protein n=1 Tax=marine sediment metagenome TaxID=412755 RepID=A0A0F9E7Q4_9ZZZZ